MTSSAIHLQTKLPCMTLAITSGKGGVGKSNLVANLSLRLAQAGKKVMVLDADLGLANLDVIYGIRPNHTLYHVLQGKKSLLDVVQTVGQNLRLIAGGSGIANLADMPADTRDQFLHSLEQLRQYSDILMIDTGAGLSSNVIGFLKYADEVLLVTTPEPTAMADAYGIVKALVASGGEFPRVSIIVNRAASAAEGFGVSSRLIAVSRQFLKVELQYKGFILEDDLVSRSVRAQKPFINLYPESRASLCISRLAENYSGKIAKVEKSSAGFLETLAGLFTRKQGSHE